MLLVGLTGGIGAGKSTVAKLLAELGAVVIDADQIAREVLSPGQPALAKVAERFGAELLTNGVLDREHLAKIVFQDEQALRDLEAITHPLIRQRFEEIVAQQPEGSVVVHDVPLLFERNLADAYDIVITVEAPLSLRKERLLARGVSPEQIEQRIAVQATDQTRRDGSDIVLVNDGEISTLSRDVERLWHEELLPAAQGQ